MTERQSQTKRNESGRATWKRLILPTALTIAIGCIGARSAQFLGSGWKVIAEAPVKLDSTPYHLTDNHDAAVVKLGISPYYFVSYDSPDGREHTLPLANKKGDGTADVNLPTIDPAKRQVRYLIVMKDHRRIPFEEGRDFAIEGNGLQGKLPGSHFRALCVPREGVRKGFHPADVERVELEVRPKP